LMKTCHIVTAFQWSDSKIGIVPWLTDYLLKLKEKGVEVTVFAPLIRVWETKLFWG
jgi:hypothetical protein